MGQKGESGEPGLHGFSGVKGEVGEPGMPGPIVRSSQVIRVHLTNNTNLLVSFVSTSYTIDDILKFS